LHLLQLPCHNRTILLALHPLLHLLLPFLSPCPRPHRALHSFPTRRSSDLVSPGTGGIVAVPAGASIIDIVKTLRALNASSVLTIDRKSTRLNSSHVAISYAVFCLKKKKEKKENTPKAQQRDEEVNQLVWSK